MVIKDLKRTARSVFDSYHYSSTYKSHKFKLVNWWQERIHVNWIFNFIKARSITPNCAVSICSVFGNMESINSASKSSKIIFFSGENKSIHKDYDDYCFHIDDSLSLSFEVLNHVNYARLPLWLITLVDPKDSFHTIKKKISHINNRRYTRRPKFCALVANNDGKLDFTGLRSQIFRDLQDIDEIESCGKLLNNSNSLKAKYKDNKIKYLQDFRFNICTENSSAQWYTTEKIIESFMSQSIPIYAGSAGAPEPQIINPNSYIYWEDNIDNASKIHELENNPLLFKELYMEKPFLPYTDEYIQSILINLEDKLREFLS